MSGAAEETACQCNSAYSGASSENTPLDLCHNFPVVGWLTKDLSYTKATKKIMFTLGKHKDLSLEAVSNWTSLTQSQWLDQRCVIWEDVAEVQAFKVIFAEKLQANLKTCEGLLKLWSSHPFEYFWFNGYSLFITSPRHFLWDTEEWLVFYFFILINYSLVFRVWSSTLMFYFLLHPLT